MRTTLLIYSDKYLAPFSNLSPSRFVIYYWADFVICLHFRFGEAMLISSRLEWVYSDCLRPTRGPLCLLICRCTKGIATVNNTETCMQPQIRRFVPTHWWRSVCAADDLLSLMTDTRSLCLGLRLFLVSQKEKVSFIIAFKKCGPHVWVLSRTLVHGTGKKNHNIQENNRRRQTIKGENMEMRIA